MSKDRKKGIHIRHAKETDLETIITLGRRLHQESIYEGSSYSQEKIESFVQDIFLRLQEHCLLIAEDQGSCIGFLGGMIKEYFFSDKRAAIVFVIYVIPEKRGSLAAMKLLHAFKRWARANKVNEIHVNVTSGIDIGITDRFLRKLGFVQTGGNYYLKDWLYPDI